MLDLGQVNKNWTLFLDRDGVVNCEKKDDYILNWAEFVFCEGVLESMKILADSFGKIIMVTNQRGVGKGLMTLADLDNIHEQMIKTVQAEKGRIDRIYYCTSLNDDDPFRKPNPGMAIQAKKDFPDLDLSRSLVIGNNISDMEFGRNAGMNTVFVKTTQPDIKLPNPAIDVSFEDLAAFAKALQKS